jgi:hypothetical protein
VEREGNENNMLQPLQEYIGKVLELIVDYGDPSSLVEYQVLEFLRIGKRTCDRHKKYIPAEECYSVATSKENKNTLFLIPDVGSQEKAEECEMLKGGDKSMEELVSYKTLRKSSKGKK